MPDPPIGDWVDLFADRDDPHRPDAPIGRMDPRVLHRARAGYYGHMSHIDHQLNRFLEVLQEFRLRENTTICFVSDHGELLGDHHRFRKSLPYEGSARVPLLLQGPAGGLGVAWVSVLTAFAGSSATFTEIAELVSGAGFESHPVAKHESARTTPPRHVDRIALE